MGAPDPAADPTEARIALLHKRATALYQCGFYSAEDGQGLMRLARSEGHLLGCEYLVLDAELQAGLRQ